MTDYTQHVGEPRARKRFPVERMTKPGDYFDVHGSMHRSISATIAIKWQSVGGRRLATFALSDRTRVMLIAIAPEI